MSADKKEQIINAAIDLFSENGFEGTSVRELANQAGVNVAMVNYYFGSKEKLFEALVEKRSLFIREKLEQLATTETPTEIEKVDAVVDHYVNRLLLQHKFHRTITLELLLVKRENLHENITRIFARNKEILMTIIQAGIRKGEFREVDVELTIVSLIGSINQVMLSKSLCRLAIAGNNAFDPYTDEAFKKRLTTHIKQLMRAHLLK